MPRMIHGSARHLLTLINDILDLAKIEAGRWKPEEQELDLHRSAADAMQLLAGKAEGGGVSLVNAVPEDLPFLHADARALKQILLNLLSNAVKFTQAGGSATVFAEEDAFGNLEFGVADTGIGIAAQDLQRVFDSFGQGQTATSPSPTRAPGSGLAIVKGLTEGHGRHHHPGQRCRAGALASPSLSPAPDCGPAPAWPSGLPKRESSSPELINSTSLRRRACSRLFAVAA